MANKSLLSDMTREEYKGGELMSKIKRRDILWLDFDDQSRPPLTRPIDWLILYKQNVWKHLKQNHRFCSCVFSAIVLRYCHQPYKCCHFTAKTPPRFKWEKRLNTHLSGANRLLYMLQDLDNWDSNTRGQWMWVYFARGVNTESFIVPTSYYHSFEALATLFTS